MVGIVLQIIKCKWLQEEFKTFIEENLCTERICLLKGEEIIMSFVEQFNLIAKTVHSTAVQKGWWESKRNEAELIALMHSELSEALEAIREGNPSDNKIPEFSGVEAELADVIIRIMDMAEANNYRVAEAIIEKVNYNTTREYRHGKKLF